MLRQFIRQPQSVWLRKATFQVHLWTGIGVGLYVLLTSVTGSAIIFRNEIFQYFTPKKLVEVSGPRLTDEELKAAELRAFPDWHVTAIVKPRRNRRNPDPTPVEQMAFEMWIERGTDSDRRFVNPYTGADLGSAISPVIVAASWIESLHVNLLAGETGRVVNGIAAIFFTLVALTGAVVWWPGIKIWRRSFMVQLRTNWKRLNWDLHSAAGIWSLLFVLMWGITGIVVSFPGPFYASVNYLSRHLNGSRLAADSIFRGAARLHFGNFPLPVKALLALFGLAPALLFVTGLLMWWSRVLRPAWERLLKGGSSDLEQVRLKPY